MSNKDSASPDDFASRADRVKSMDIPLSSEKCIIVAPNKEALGFRLNCYKKTLEKYGIDEKTFNNTIQKVF